ncbi:hypothetical protein BTVI_147029 [Pitangus sulphuratus]|nr:hypothetical protein BTVI_147029 [Pitangus sulphuratus]
MTSSSLAICLGPNLLSPPKEELLPLEAMLVVTEKMTVLEKFLIENFDEIFGKKVAGMEESPAPTDRSTVLGKVQGLGTSLGDTGTPVEDNL